MSQFANSLLSSISNILFYPVVLALIASLIWIIYQTGICIREAWQRSRKQYHWANGKIGLLERKCRTASEVMRDIELEKIIQLAEKQSNSRLNHTRFSIRSGPTLGLMGTLIPMAEALLGLS